MSGKISRIAGPVIEAEGVADAMMSEVLLVGRERLVGEVIRVDSGVASVQVYEDTTGIEPGEPVERTGRPLSVELGPGLLSTVYDGIQRPLEVLKSETGDFIIRGSTAPALSSKKRWDFAPAVKKGKNVSEGAILGTVAETELIEHKILVPPGVSGKVKELSKGKFTVEKPVGLLADGTELKLSQYWPVKKPRPITRKLDPEIPLVTGQRILDFFFPIAKGGTAAIPGPFGSGKTVTQHQLAKWSDADVVVYVGCGERGNEITQVLEDFPSLKDPKSGKPLMQRTVLIANTSNMPVAAREASVYTGVTIAEYYRDMGYDVALMADSSSRWAEAMREISSRLEEMPGEEGYPPYLSERLAAFYERAGRVSCLGGQKGSVSIIGAVSPPGGDFSEPVTQNTLRIVRVFWGLDASLADRRHFPSINWLTSYSLYGEFLDKWFAENVDANYSSVRDDAMRMLQRESELMEIVKLVGADTLPDAERLVLAASRMIREDFLQQDAFHDVDTYCAMKKQYEIISLIMKYYESARSALDSGVEYEKLESPELAEAFAKLKYFKDKQFEDSVSKIKDSINSLSKK